MSGSLDGVTLTSLEPQEDPTVGKLSDLADINPKPQGAGKKPTTHPTAMKSPNPRDPWALASGNEYRLDRFYTRATDGAGHDATLAVKVSPALHAQLGAAVQGGKLPAYRTFGDIVRDALVHRLRWIADNYDDVVDESILDAEQRQATLDRLNNERDRWTKYIDNLRDTLERLISDGELDEAGWLLSSMEFDDSMTEAYTAKLSEVVETAAQRLVHERDQEHARRMKDLRGHLPGQSSSERKDWQ